MVRMEVSVEREGESGESGGDSGEKWRSKWQ